ncbi:SusC/RagA family TonB-linked outer membrane protein [Pedobacter sp. G11]|uniref:SusC/RagA family TonB-linked outer membrane protein n=1 Tax=Pedobacter sp. G11 TaxID=2482728 RepID=UPI000F5ECCE1|nr:SusC/RagA family TonB-linked outer membrane protein [Pedobacter sp. G11]AZI25785.1 SusC/RagA family TonB-linked outer membrane protein [Pedobacter sp. G11]
MKELIFNHCMRVGFSATLFILTYFCCPFKTLAQQRERLLSGTVISSNDRNPISGAILTIGKKSTNSDSDGKFSISTTMEIGDLKVSFVGFKTKLIPFDFNKSTVMSIVLEVDSLDLGSVEISTGYERKARERVTGSVDLVDNKKLNAQFGPNILNRLEGMTPAVSFDRDGQRPGLTVRGISSINASKSPLIILDNFPYAGEISNINPNDIESITVLKDAAASSIWGARAGNGVIVITSKAGRKNQEMSIALNSNLSITSRPDIYKSQNFISSSDYIDLEKFLYSKGYYQSLLENTSNYPVVSQIVELLRKRSAATAEEQAQIDRQIEDLKGNDVRGDIDRYLYSTGYNQQYALSINGGSEKNTYFYSAGYDKGKNQLSATNDRLSIKAQNAFNLSDRLSLRTNLLYTATTNRSGKPDPASIRSGVSQGLYPYAMLADGEGNSLAIPKIYRESYVATAGNGKLLDWKYYPLEDYKNSESSRKSQDFLANVNLEYQILPWLKAGARYQFEKQITDGKTLNTEGSFFTRNMINQFTQLNQVTGAPKYIIPRGSILDLNKIDLSSQNLRTQVDVDKSWSDHSISGVIGAEVGQSRTNGNSYRTFGYNDELGVATGLVDPVNSYPLFYGGTATIGNNNTFYGTDNRSIAYYASGAYTYLGRYSFSGSIRKDQSNIFAVKTNQKGRPFWSAGVAWDLTKEAFFPLSTFSYFKVRATYGTSGNVDNSLSALTTMSYTGSPNSLTGFTQAVINKFANSDLRWEKTGMFNIGIDFATSGGRISGSLDYYQKKGTDLLGDALIDITTGLKVTTVRKNVAAMSGKGIDLTLNTLNIDSKVKWRSTLLLAYNQNRVRNYYLSTYQGSNYITPQGNLITPVEGYPVYSIFSYRSAGLDPQTGNPLGYLGDKVSTDYTAIIGSGTQVSDLVYNGPSTPVVSGAIRNTLNYKNFELSVNITYKLGYYFRKSSVAYSSLFAGWVQHADYMSRWKKEGDERFTDIPSLIYPADPNRDAFYAGSETLVRRADHLRLQYVSIAYNVPGIKLKKLPVRDLSITANASNLGMLWVANKDGVDPDYPYDISPPKMLSFGLRAQF